VDADFETNASIPTETRELLRSERFAARPVLLEARTGMAALVGPLGATAAFDPWGRVALGGGLGVSPAGLQLGAYVRARPLVFTSRRWLRLHAIGVELGYATGPYRNYQMPVGDGETHSAYSASWERVHWLQPQLIYETRSFRGFNLLAGIGVAVPLASAGYRCLDAIRCSLHGLDTIPSVTFAVGYAWALGE